MNNSLIRFISACALSIIYAIAIRILWIDCFGLFVNLFSNFSFKNLIFTGAIISVGGTILFWLVFFLIMGLHWAGKGSKWIATLPILIFIDYFIGDCLYLFCDGYQSTRPEEIMIFLHQGGGDLYTAGAILTAIVMLISYIVAGAALLVKENNN